MLARHGENDKAFMEQAAQMLEGKARFVDAAIMSPVPLIVALATALATQLMLPLHLDRYYLAAVATGACLSLVLTALLVPDHGAIGTAISVVTTEFAIGRSGPTTNPYDPK